VLKAAHGGDCTLYIGVALRLKKWKECEADVSLWDARVTLGRLGETK
jgi:hypothetical protein